MTENANDVQMNQETGRKKKHGVITYPSKIGPYTIKKTIGEGAFSIVKLVYHEMFKEHYACKIVPIRMLKERNLFPRFELEIRISQLMRHPGITAITDFLKDDNNYYIFMEYYPYGNLLDYVISKSHLSDDESKALMYQIFDALEYIHAQKVSHRDLKPENIMIDHNGHLRISDFGLSRFVGENDLVKTPCGSPCYVSPECISGKDYNGFSSDVWSCGVILYAMVTGMLPWTKRKMHDLFRQIRAGEYKIPEKVPPQCSSLIYLLLTVDYKNRISLEEAKKHTWFDMKTPEDCKKYIDYVIPVDSLKCEIKDIKIGDCNENKRIPFLSTKVIDIYFRPDVDYDYDYQFSEIKNIHAIIDSIPQDKCESSYPYLPFESTMKLLEEDKDSKLKIRKRVVINPNVEGIENYNINDDNNGPNLGLKAASGVKIRTIASTGKLILLNKSNDKSANTALARNKTHGRFKKKDLGIDKIKDSSDKNGDTSNENIRKKKIERIKLKPRRSAKLPRRFEPTNQNE